MSKNITKTIIWVTVFSIAMGFLETSVVVYLRALYYPEGFVFPMKIIDYNIAITEFGREIATIVMLAGAGIMAGRKNIERFAFFIYSFAVWDIFYYVFLKIILDWPASLFTWDILFLVPVTWVGPVIAPVINSLTMILLAAMIIYFSEKKGNAGINKIEWVLLITGAIVIIISYTEEYLKFMLGRFSFTELIGVSDKPEILKYACTYIPEYFNWYIFGTGQIMHLTAIILYWRRKKNLK